MDYFKNNFRLVLFCLLLWIFTCFLYWPARQFDFVNYDDPVYVTENSNVNGGLNWPAIQWAFTASHASNWHPLTWLSHMLDVECFGLDAGRHHLINVLLHATNTVLLFLVLWRMTRAGWASLLVAALFAWHPLHVESVAWIAERKDVLSTCFWLLTLWFYVGHARRAKADGPAPWWNWNYASSILCFGLGLLAKPMLVTLPCVLLLLDYWPLGRAKWERSELRHWSRLCKEKIPFFVLTLASCIVTYLVQAKGGAVATLNSIPLLERVGNAFVAYAMYLKKTVWPSELAVFYPHPGSWPGATVWIAGLLLLSVTVAVVVSVRRRPFFAVGWFWFIGTLIPVVGLVQVGDQAYADRYTYVPLIGVFILIAWAVRGCSAAFPRWRIATGLACAVLLAGCWVVTREQLQHWRNGETLFRHALAVTQNNYVAHNNLGNLLSTARKLEEARKHYEASLAILPSYEDAHLNLGRLLADQGDKEGAIRQLTLAVRFKPTSAEGYYNLGTTLAAAERYQEAFAAFDRALALNPNHTNAYYNLGIALTKQGRFAEAEANYLQALRLNPNHGFAHYNLGLALQGQNRLDEARHHFEEAIRLAPDYLPARTEMGAVLMALGQFEAATALYQQLLQSSSNNPVVLNNLGLALARLNRPDEAALHFSQVVRLEPGNSDARYNLGNALMAQGKFGEAAQQYAEVRDRQPADAAACMKLGLCQVRLGDANGAIAAFRDAMRRKPDWPAPIRELAWLLATHRDPAIRNPTEALSLAERACAITGRSELESLAALDAAYAACGEFAKAIEIAERVKTLAAAAGRQPMGLGASQRLELYRAGRAYVSP